MNTPTHPSPEQLNAFMDQEVTEQEKTSLETHLKTCVTEGLHSEDVAERERVIGEIVDVLGATGKL